MESPISARHTSFPAWSIQQDPWDANKLVGSSRFSSYATKLPHYRYESDAFGGPIDSQFASWPRDSLPSPTELPWQHSSTPVFSFATNGATQRKNITEHSHHYLHDHAHNKHGVDHGVTTKQLDHNSPPSTTLPSSNIAGMQASRPPKKHVKSACYNCKRAHLSCDVLRPCTRCVQTGKIDGCVDVPQRRKGRPRLRQDSLRKSGRSAITKPISIKPPLVALHEHRPLNPLQNFAFHTEYSLPADLCNVCSYIPVGFLGLDLKIVQTNPHFRSLFDFLGDLQGRSLEHLVEQSELGLLQNMRLALRQEAEREMSVSPPFQVIEHGDVAKLPPIEAQDIPRMTKPFVNRRETVYFRFADGNSRPLSVEFSLSKTHVMFVTLAFPPIRAASSTVLPSSQPPQYSMAISGPPSSYSQQGFDPSRNHYSRQTDRGSFLTLPSPDMSVNFSTSPTSSYSMSSSASIPANSRHGSLVNHRSYEHSLMPGSMGNTQPQASGQMDSYPRYVLQSSAVTTPQHSTGQQILPSNSTAHLAPLQERAPSQINSSRKLPPIPGLGLGSPDSQASDNAGSQASRSQQIFWQNQGQEATSKTEVMAFGAAQAQDSQGESPSSKKSRMDVKELTS